MIFELPEDKDFKPVGWRFIVRPALPNCEAPGNLTIQVRRRKGDDFEVPTESHPHPAMMSMDVYLWPTVSDVSPRRLVNAANLIRQPNPEIKELQRFVEALDLSEDCDYVSPFAKHQAINDEETEAILQPLSVSQRDAFFHIVNSKHRIVLIQGPPGTGKTELATKVTKILNKLRETCLGCGPSNVATDNLASGCNEAYPEARALRRHAKYFENKSLKQGEAKAYYDEHPDEIPQREEVQRQEFNDAGLDPQIIEEARLFYNLLLTMLETDYGWQGSKKSREMFKHMGTWLRSLETAGLIHSLGQETKDTTEKAEDKYAAFRAAVKSSMLHDKTREELAEFKKLEKEVFEDTMRQAYLIFKAADTDLSRFVRPSVILIDEGCQATELESLLPWIHNSDTVQQMIIIDDPQHLLPDEKLSSRITRQN
ncbi:hypothetical protein G7Y79_00024g055300 [Physcia stellaris]|nr:hypothetical protein G7Y79_00024g055300 [Physcia stellaris]